MSRSLSKAGLLSAGLACAVFAVSAHAAQPLVATAASPAKKPLSVQQKNQMARALRLSPAARKDPPKTMAQVRMQKLAGGGAESEIPEELYHHLGAQPDDKGRMRVSDIDPAAPHQAKVEVADEL